jgi:hypothetical protein
VEIHIDRGGVEIRAVHDLDRFKALIVTKDNDLDVDRALTAAGMGFIDPVEPDHVFIAIRAIRQAAAVAQDDPLWEHRFRAMLDYASARGWVRDDAYIRAHIDVAS